MTQIQLYNRNFLTKEYIIPGQLASEKKLPLDEVYRKLEEMRKKKFIDVRYQFTCPHCGKVKIYETINSIEKQCPQCQKETNVTDHVIVIYQVI